LQTSPTHRPLTGSITVLGRRHFGRHFAMPAYHLLGFRNGLAALALTTNPSVLTAAGNDYGFEQIFARQIESLVSAHDVLVALSTSGESANILRGIEAGRTRRAYLVAFTGETGGALADKVDLLLNVPSRDPQRIQEAHITVGHIACTLIEELALRA